MTEAQNTKQYDLEDRTLEFAKNVRILVRKMPKNISSTEDCKQLVRSSGSAGANYIEANESLSKKDFIMRVKISRKEAKESAFWLKLLDTSTDQSLENEIIKLIREAQELTNICGAIIRKSEQSLKI